MSMFSDDTSARPWRPERLYRDATAALRFLTRLPVASAAHAEDRPLSRAAGAFPLVGLLLGALAGLTFAIAAAVGLPSPLSALLAVAAMVLATGALHEDGLGDVADALATGADRERALAIMRDSRIGTYGLLAVLFLTLVRILSLATLALPGSVLAAAIVAAGLSRLYMAGAMRWLPPARPDGLGRGAGRPEESALLTGAGICLLLLLLAALWLPFGALLLAAFIGAAAAYAAGRFATRRFGGQTGDVLGGIQQISEAAILLTLAAAAAP